MTKLFFDLQLFAGVDDDEVEDPAAGDHEEEETEEEDFSVDYFQEEEEEEEVEDYDDTEEEEEDDDEEDPVDPRAFAKRLAQEREKIKAEYEQKYSSQPQQRQSSQQRPLSQKEVRDQLDKLSEELSLTPEAVEVLYQQQLALTQQGDALVEAQNVIQGMREDITKAEAKEEVEAIRRTNPDLPKFQDKKVAEIRKQYRDRFGVTLPWSDAYKQLVADQVMDGSFSRKAQQQTLKRIKNRDKVTTKAGSKTKSAKRPDIWDLPADQFEELQRKALSGELTES